jgi:hypothetical protein
LVYLLVLLIPNSYRVLCRNSMFFHSLHMSKPT